MNAQQHVLALGQTAGTNKNVNNEQMPTKNAMSSIRHSEVVYLSKVRIVSCSGSKESETGVNDKVNELLRKLFNLTESVFLMRFIVRDRWLSGLSRTYYKH